MHSRGGAPERSRKVVDAVSTVDGGAEKMPSEASSEAAMCRRRCPGVLLGHAGVTPPPGSQLREAHSGRGLGGGRSAPQGCDRTASGLRCVVVPVLEPHDQFGAPAVPFRGRSAGRPHSANGDLCGGAAQHPPRSTRRELSPFPRICTRGVSSVRPHGYLRPVRNPCRTTRHRL